AGPAESAADDHHTGTGSLAERGRGEERGGRRQAEEPAAGRGHFGCAANQAASAWISSSVNPLAIRSMTVPARWPERNSCMARTIASRSRPASRTTGEVTRAEAG